jgi:hypothetical protein
VLYDYGATCECSLIVAGLIMWFKRRFSSAGVGNTRINRTHFCIRMVCVTDSGIDSCITNVDTTLAKKLKLKVTSVSSWRSRGLVDLDTRDGTSGISEYGA